MSGSYSFIDIVVHNKIREHFLAGRALVVMSGDLATAIWANGPGAALFGFDRVIDILGRDVSLTVHTQRQIMTRNRLQEGHNRTITMRVTSGLTSQLVTFQLFDMDLSDGTRAYGLFLAQASQHPHSPIPFADVPTPFADVIAGLDEDNTHVAILDERGSILTASVHFDTLCFSPKILKELIREVRQEKSRVVKRSVNVYEHTLFTGIAWLSDQPECYLLFAILDKETSGISAIIGPTTESAISAQDPSLTNAIFVFDPLLLPVRFVWKVDANARFTELSSEFSATLGPRAADIIGQRFTEVAQVFGIDKDGTIAALLEGRNTWSGRTVLWPIEGTSLRVPVDLAALPVYSRERTFIGFRGFGIIRSAEAEEDPYAIGQALAMNFHAIDARKEKSSVIQSHSELDIAKSVQKMTSHVESLQGHEIIYLEECRAPHSESKLTPNERNAFREIADRLRRDAIDTRKTGDLQEEESPSETRTLDQQQKTENIALIQPKEPLTTKTSNRESALPLNATVSTSLDNRQAIIDADKTSGINRVATSLLKRIPVPLLIYSGEQVHFANQALLNLTGYSSTQALILSGGLEVLFAERCDEDEGNGVSGMILRCANGQEQNVEAHLQAVPWGKRHALMLSLVPKPLAPSVTIETPRVETNSLSLQIRIDELTSILDTATDGVVIIDAEGLIRSMNHSAEALFGYSQKEIVGRSFAVLFAIESQHIALDYLNSLADNGVASVLNDGREVIGKEAQGRVIPMFMTIGKLAASNRYCAVLRDITQWKRAEEDLTNARGEAEHASRQKTDFLARISHEIRTPLNAIIGFSELMLDEKFGTIGHERYRDYLRDINRSGNHVLALVNDLLDISKIEAGALEMQFEGVALNDVIAETVAIMQPQANRECVIIRSSFSSNLPAIVADARSIRQIAFNLLSNAVRFTAPGGQVIVSTTYETNGDVVMRVRDTGVGMTQSEVEQALQPFKQINMPSHNRASHNRDGKTCAHWRENGTGLGLPLTKAITEANKALFVIESLPAHGTTVTITFPSIRVLVD